MPKGINKKVISLIKDELGGKIVKEFVQLRAKTSYLADNNNEHKEVKGTKKVYHKKKI